ncbi:VOC family protein [Actinobacillus equuli subsp. haemolyticus]|uniref:VOC family protein n=1 Tax=Actinobacillus equuli TaxID=718 RepID=UPI00244302BD|nr:VOC family protein [Actinobacillus equuli]WGE62470.1 VOC family protein [Actinobacillus equuli subsp. haemolyticus]
MIQENAKFYEKMTAYFGDFSEFQQKIQQIAHLAMLDLNQFKIDHLAVRMNDWQTAEQWRSFLLEQGELLKESEVNGRPIALIKRYQPLAFLGQEVSIIELPFPKDKVYPQQGWEHIEIVYPMLKNETVEQWTQRALKQFRLLINANLTLKISQPKVEGEQLPNPSIAISVKSATYCNPYCLKLHPYDINEVIRSESHF